MREVTVLALATGLLAMNACKKDNDNSPKDTAKPVITLSTPTDADEFISGQIISVSAKITDDTDLSQYKIEVHDVFDGHTHLKTGSPAFKWDTIVNVSGKEVLLNFNIQLPVDIAAGPYDFIINALDKSGNEAEFAEAEITIKNSTDSILPVINVTPSPAPNNGVIELNSTNKTITLSGTITDNEAVKGYEVLLLHKNDKKNYVDIDRTVDIINETITFDDSWPDGEYLLVIEAFDLKNNLSEVEFDVKRTK